MRLSEMREEVSSGELLAQHRRRVIPVEAGDVLDADFLRARGLALVLIGAVAKAFGIHLADHRKHALVTLRLALRQVSKVGNLGRHKQHRRGILAGSHTSTAADAGRRIKRSLRIVLGNRNRVGINRRASAHIHIAARRDEFGIVKRSVGDLRSGELNGSKPRAK